MTHQFSSSRLITHAVRDAALAEAARVWGCRPREILSGDRRRPYVFARHYAAWLLRQHKLDDGSARFSYPEIALAVNLVDHTSAIHAVRAAERRPLPEWV